VACGLINTTLDGKQFGFCARDIDCMMNGFSDWFIVDMSMGYGSSNIVFNASICDDQSM